MRKTHRFQLRMSEEDKRNLEKWTKKLNDLNPNETFDNSKTICELLKSDRFEIKPYLKKDALIMARSISAINKIGVNINQISRNLNYFSKQNKIDQKQLSLLQKDIDRLNHYLSTAFTIIEQNDHENQ